jgi:hypothetical protein
MAKNGRSNEQNNHENRKPNKNSEKSSNKLTIAQPKCIFLIKKAKPNYRQIKASFTDSTRNEVKEVISTYSDGGQKELLIDLEKHLHSLGNGCDLFSKGK